MIDDNICDHHEQHKEYSLEFCDDFAGTEGDPENFEKAMDTNGFPNPSLYLLPSMNSSTQPRTLTLTRLKKAILGLQSLREDPGPRLKEAGKESLSMWLDVYTTLMKDDLDGLVELHENQGDLVEKHCRIVGLMEQRTRDFEKFYKQKLQREFYLPAKTWCQGSANVVTKNLKLLVTRDLRSASCKPARNLPSTCLLFLQVMCTLAGLEAFNSTRDYMNARVRAFRENPVSFCEEHLRGPPISVVPPTRIIVMFTDDLVTWRSLVLEPAQLPLVMYVEMDAWSLQLGDSAFSPGGTRLQASR